jgi:hypothetical protein
MDAMFAWSQESQSTHLHSDAELVRSKQPSFSEAKHLLRPTGKLSMNAMRWSGYQGTGCIFAGWKGLRTQKLRVLELGMGILSALLSID